MRRSLISDLYIKLMYVQEDMLDMLAMALQGVNVDRQIMQLAVLSLAYR